MPTTDPAAAHLAGVLNDDREPVPAPDPVTVRVDGPVTVTDRPARSITTANVSLPDTLLPVQIANALPTRTRLRIRNVGGTAVAIGREGVTFGTGYLLGGNEYIDLDARCAVWGVIEEPGQAARVSVLSELAEG